MFTNHYKGIPGEVALSTYEGHLKRWTENGLGYVVAKDGQIFPFKFNTVKVNGDDRYRGQTAAELGFHVGQHIKFQTNADGQVITVFVHEPAATVQG